MLRFVHAADLHLDSPLRGLSRYEGAPTERLRIATRDAFTRLVTTCLEENAQLLLIAGDLFDGEWRDYRTGMFFVRQLQRLRETGTRVVWLRGNHDADSVVSRKLAMPEHVHELPVDAPSSVRLEPLGVAVHGQGFAARDTYADLAASYPAPLAGLANIGLLHTSLEGREGHASYAPTRQSVLVDRGYDYWALGHVHAHEIVSRAPWIVFPGNLQGRHCREVGPKGVVVGTIEDTRVTEISHRALDVVRWARLELDVTDARHVDDLLAHARRALLEARRDAEERLLAVRVELKGRTSLHDGLVRERDRITAELRNEMPDDAWLERVRLATRPPVDERSAARSDLVARIEAVLAGLSPEDPLVTGVVGELAPIARKLSRAPGESIDVGELVDDAKHTLPAAVRALFADDPVEL